MRRRDDVKRYWDQPIPAVGTRVEYTWDHHPFDKARVPVSPVLQGVPLTGVVRGTVVEIVDRRGYPAIVVDLDREIINNLGKAMHKHVLFAAQALRNISLLDALAEAAE